MADSKTEIMEVFSQLSPDNQRTLLLCARTAEVAEEAAMSWPVQRGRIHAREAVSCRP